MVRIFYHKSDLDGKCAGAIVFDLYRMSSANVKVYGVDYNDHLLPSQYNDGDTFYVVDFCFNVDDMITLEKAGTLIWIDHHKTAIDKMEKAGLSNIAGLREVGRAGCELTWEFLHVESKIPLIVLYLGRYDVWDHSNPKVLQVQYGMRQGQWLPQSSDWIDLLNESDYGKHMLKAIINEGRLLHKYQQAQDKEYAKGMSYVVEWWCYRALVVNKAYAGSMLFDSIYDSNLHDILVTWACRGNEYKYSIYTHKDIDVSDIAKLYGGGGHQKAAGFFSSIRVV